MRNKKVITVNIPKEQAIWLDEMAVLNNRSKSYLVELAISKLIEMVEGVPE